MAAAPGERKVALWDAAVYVHRKADSQSTALDEPDPAS
jgi:hypothetical protein